MLAFLVHLVFILLPSSSRWRTWPARYPSLPLRAKYFRAPLSKLSHIPPLNPAPYRMVHVTMYFSVPTRRHIHTHFVIIVVTVFILPLVTPVPHGRARLPLLHSNGFV
ncbi:hypothetical protein BV25DRAFT_123065 [Artomyces pyxidatus]|uniref:Uncharacterized protein n=1 Tax=Artomyces pyxidatus TaxID=48021 RepID=A0ACB8TLJ0_9AGAM|nr:hypothetical protein BV25DRAFT_123065 [Artomyces pyxidatus]